MTDDERKPRSHSRATSLSRSNKQGSTISRNQSLIRKNIAASSTDLKPSDVLIERFVAWKAIVKQLIAYFEGIADIENNTARELTKLCAVIQVPFRAGNQFLGEGGLQDFYYGIRDKTRTIADQHANLGRTIDGSIVQHLQKLKSEIKAHIKNVQNDTGKLATNVAKERELSVKLISELAHSISSYKNTPMNVTSKTDPYVSNMAVSRQLSKQVHEENALQQSIITMQQNSAHFEEALVRSLQSAWQTFDEWQSRSSSTIQSSWRSLSTHIASLSPDREWLSFSARTDHLLDPETPLRNPDTIMYPSKEDPTVVAVHMGMLERKKRYTRTYRESYFVLTPAGFLHEYVSSDHNSHGGSTPIFSLFLPACTLGPPSASDAKSHKFHIEGRKDGSGTTKSGGGLRASLRGSIRGRGKGGSSAHAWSFRARSREEMMEWWNDIRMLCARYLVASEEVERRGPVVAAVGRAGYGSEGSDTDEAGVTDGEGTGGSSVDEEGYENDGTGTYPPSYSHPHHEKGAGDYQADEKREHTHDEPHSEGANVSRRPSKRQQEKAPEGREPHARAIAGGADDVGEGSAHGHGKEGEGTTGRFKEEL